MKHSVLIRLRQAKADRDAHAEQCTLWDYESNNGCSECDYHAATVRRLVRAVKKEN